MKQFLMCYPKNFLVNYEINDWMKDKIGTVNEKLAISQWEELHKQLLSLGNNIMLMRNQSPEVPDLVFTANAALKIGNSVLISKFSKKERQAESYYYKQVFENLNLHTDMRCIEENINFEGAGDILLHKKSDTYVLTYGFRTDQKALKPIIDFIAENNQQSSVLQVQLVDSRFYHLDTCFCPLDNGDILYFPDAFSSQSQKELIEKFSSQLIKINEADAINFACNSINIDRFIILNKSSAKLIKTLLDRNFIVIETPLNEFLKAGGSAKCLTMEI